MKLQEQKFQTSQQAFEFACQQLGYDAEALIPDLSAQPEWLQKYTAASIMRPVIAEAINEGRKPLFDGNELTWEAYFYIKRNSSGAGFSDSNSNHWLTRTNVGARLKFFNRADCDYFRNNFLDLHEAVLINI